MGNRKYPDLKIPRADRPVRKILYGRGSLLLSAIKGGGLLNSSAAFADKSEQASLLGSDHITAGEQERAACMY